MTEEQLRTLIREEIARALAREPRPPVQPHGDPAMPRGGHGPSHLLFALAPLGDDGSCVIEPAVACTHCGYCKSLGH